MNAKGNALWIRRYQERLIRLQDRCTQTIWANIDEENEAYWYAREMRARASKRMEDLWYHIDQSAEAIISFKK